MKFLRSTACPGLPPFCRASLCAASADPPPGHGHKAPTRWPSPTPGAKKKNEVKRVKSQRNSIKNQLKINEIQ